MFVWNERKFMFNFKIIIFAQNRHQPWRYRPSCNQNCWRSLTLSYQQIITSHTLEIKPTDAKTQHQPPKKHFCRWTWTTRRLRLPPPKFSRTRARDAISLTLRYQIIVKCYYLYLLISHHHKKHKNRVFPMHARGRK